MRNKFTPDLLQRVFDPWSSDKKEQFLSFVRNRITESWKEDSDFPVYLSKLGSYGVEQLGKIRQAAEIEVFFFTKR
ncbi:unnamed protein product [Timema podura]|uniref:Uncharacterized protein n=1 Tax=Timema podura TaxID=61482 RepID=A0ABN7PGX5_TIMPD|nr:unnamed protein product [Timema podura]